MKIDGKVYQIEISQCVPAQFNQEIEISKQIIKIQFDLMELLIYCLAFSIVVILEVASIDQGRFSQPVIQSRFLHSHL